MELDSSGAEKKKTIPDFRPEDRAVLRGGTAEIDVGQLEARQLNRGLAVEDLKKEAETNEHNRSERFKDHFEMIAILVIWALFFVFLGISAVWLLHMVLPASACWLKKDQVDKLQAILTGGAIISLVAHHFKRRIGKN